MKQLIILAILSLSLLSCVKETVVKPNMSEVETYIEQNSTISDVDKEALRNAEVRVGIRQETLRFMFGEPKKITTIQQPWGTQEVWLYKNGGKKNYFIEDGGVVVIEEAE